MAIPVKNGNKRRKINPDIGKNTQFTADKQPPGENKSKGWQERRAERLLTQAILTHITKGTNLQEYVKSLYIIAKKGNPKAIETINRGIEEEVARIDMNHTGGFIVEMKPADGCEPLKDAD